MRINPKYTALTGVLLAAAGFKYWIITSGSVPFNADEAIVALMARHILGGETPAFFYGQAYMGSLDAYLVALGFAILGETVWVVRVVQALVFLATTASTYILAEKIFKSWKAGLVAGLLFAIPAVNTSLYTTVTLGGYGEALLLGNLILMVSLRIAESIQKVSHNLAAESEKDTRMSWLGWFLAWGVLVGLGLWVFGITMVYTIPAFFLLLWWVDKPGLKLNQVFVSGWIAAAAAGFIIGAEPWWAYAFNHGLGSLVGELSGNVVNIEGSSFLLRSASHAVNYFILGLPALIGLRPPWEVRWLIIPLIPFVIIFWGAAAAWTLTILQNRKASPGVGLLAGVLATQALFFIFTPFGIDPSGRYFLPSAAPIAILAGGWVAQAKGRAGKAALAGLALVILFQFAGNLDCIRRMPPGLTTQFNFETVYNRQHDDELAAFLIEKGETRGYTNYWVAYPLAFESKEQLIFVPRLPYHLNLGYTERDDRYSPYTELVSASESTAYITTRHHVLEDTLRAGFRGIGVSWDEHIIGDTLVFYNLSRVVHPEEIGFGRDKQ